MKQDITYEISRHRGRKLQDHLQRSIRAFYQRHGHLPNQVIVSTTAVEKVEDALHSLDLPSLTVGATGGCLAGEVWLGVGEE